MLLKRTSPQTLAYLDVRLRFHGGGIRTDGQTTNVLTLETTCVDWMTIDHFRSTPEQA